MGWKNVKEHYKIEHIVQVRKGNILIGSPYINDIIVIDLEGKILKKYDGWGNDDLNRYQNEFEKNPALLKELISTPDKFEKAITVYTFEGGKIVEKLCEEVGYPNVTHNGELMYENTYSTDKNKIIAYAKRNAAAGKKILLGTIADTEEKLKELKAMLKEDEDALAMLERDYPNIGNEEK